MSIGFIGFQGVGKTKRARALARRLGLEHFDTDFLIEQSDDKKRSCREIFRTEGAFSFRQRENNILDCLDSNKGSVISFGGGSALDRVRELCTTCVYLYAPMNLAQELMNLKGGIFVSKEFEAFYQRREKRYRFFADVIINVASHDVFFQICNSVSGGVCGK